MSSVITYLETTAKRLPDKCAFVDDSSSVTFSELLAVARRIGTGLIRSVGHPNKPVMVFIERDVQSICAFMGILMSRNFYVPVDTSQPIERIKAMIRQVEPAAIIANGNVPAGLGESLEVPVVDFEALCATEADAQLIDEVRKGCLDIDPCYAICTSGSTGVPKCVLVSHRSVLDFIPYFVETFGFSEEDVLGNQAPFDFDVSVKDIYTSLYCGATTYIIPRKCFSMPKLLVRTLNERQITSLTWAVSALCIIASVNGFKHGAPESVRRVLFSGETMPIKMLNIWRENIPQATFVNLYGPTEITCNCMYYVVEGEFAPEDRLPLGQAFPNEQVLVLNEANEPVGPGETGEICVVGTCLALGYYRDPQRTSEAFVQNPLNDSYPQRMYRTGDLAMLGEDGNYYFSARKDFQIKHMGHRIELEEIETHLNAATGIERACCLFDEARNKIVALYVGEATKKDIFAELKAKLPKYMIPNVFMQRDALPLNKNGKIDRQMLRRYYEESK